VNQPINWPTPHQKKPCYSEIFNIKPWRELWIPLIITKGIAKKEPKKILQKYGVKDPEGCRSIRLMRIFFSLWLLSGIMARSGLRARFTGRGIYRIDTALGFGKQHRRR